VTLRSVQLRCQLERLRTHLILVSTIILLSAGSEAESARKYLDLCSIIYPSDATIEWECRTLRAGESLEKLFGEHWIDVVRFNRIDRRHAQAGRSIKVPKQLYDLQAFTPLPLSYPSAELDEQFVLIDLSEQFLGAYEYGSLRFAMPIASGEVKNPTPVGQFRLTAAHRAHESCLYMIEGTN